MGIAALQPSIAPFKRANAPNRTFPMGYSGAIVYYWQQC
jgi:hypothetical protein